MEKVERRRFVRVPFKSETILKTQDARIEGTINNLGLGGAFINTKGKIEQNTDVEIEIILHDPPPDVNVVLSAKVVRLAPEGIGIQFTGMSMEVYERLRDTIAGVHGDKKKVVAEFLKYMDLEAYF
ncbi:MAG: PilZ domain-containing protein [Syntrophobacteraceae bacterium]|jgi:c-di-GMP-binding flagellar brake protein YcgR